MAYREKFQRGRADRPGGLPPARAQRGRRAGLHAAAHVRRASRQLPTVREQYAAQLVREGVLTADEADAAGRRRRTSGWWRSSRPSSASMGKGPPAAARQPAGGGPRGGHARGARAAHRAQRAAAHAGRRGSRCTRSSPSSSSGGARRSGPTAASTGRTPRRSRSRACWWRACRSASPGQDSERGTFSQRHAGAARRERPGRHWCPLQHLPGRARRRSSCTTARCRSWRRWASSTATAPPRRRRWCCGRRSSATS